MADPDIEDLANQLIEGAREALESGQVNGGEEVSDEANGERGQGPTRVDPDGTVYEWNEEEQDWFPRIDEDFIELPTVERLVNCPCKLVTVHNVVDADNIFVTLDSDNQLLSELDDQLKQYTNIKSDKYVPPPEFNSIPVGSHIIAYSVKAGKHCRAILREFPVQEILANNPNLYCARFEAVDYGSMVDVVKWKYVRPSSLALDLFDMCKMPPIAKQFSLHNIQPFGHIKKWNNECRQFIETFALHRRMVMYEKQRKNRKIYVDFSHYGMEDVEFGRVTLTEALTHLLFVEYIDPPAKIERPLPLYPVLNPSSINGNKSVIVSHVASPDLLFVNLQVHYQELKCLQDELVAYNNLDDGSYTYYCPVLNYPCVARFKKDKKFYRALISGVKSPHTVKVTYVDFGNSEEVSYRDLRLIKKHLMDLPIQAIPCGLADIGPKFSFNWSANVTKILNDMICGDSTFKVVCMIVLGVEKEKYSIKLMQYDPDKKIAININEELVKNRYANSTGPASLPEDDKSGIVDPQTCNSKALELFNSNLPVNASDILRQLVERYKTAKFSKATSLIKVAITNHLVWPFFWVRLMETESYFNYVFKQMQSEYTNSRSLSSENSFREGDSCAFKVLDGKVHVWLRGCILEQITIKIEGRKDSQDIRFNILAVDFGTIEKNVLPFEIRPLVPKLSKDKGFAIKCLIPHLKPSGGTDWSQASKEEFIRIVTSEENKLNLCILVQPDDIENSKDDLTYAQLYIRKEFTPGPLDPKKTIYSSVGRMLVEDLGVAHFDRFYKCVVCDDAEEVNDPNIAFLKPGLSTQGNNVLSLLRVNNMPTGQSKFFNYLPSVLPNYEFVGYGTHVDEDLNVYFRVVLPYKTEREQPISLVNNEIVERLKEGELREFCGPYFTGSACTAFCTHDNTWNRAEIVGSRRIGEFPTFEVEFVDYGQREAIFAEHLKSEIFGLEIPKLALKCILLGVERLPEVDQKRVQDEIAYTILDRKFHYKWQNHPDLPMEVTITLEDNNDLRTFLINRDLIKQTYSEDRMSLKALKILNAYERASYPPYEMKCLLNKFYKVTISHHLEKNLLFLQLLDQEHYFNEEDKKINMCYHKFQEMLEDVRGNIIYSQQLNESDITPGRKCIVKWQDDEWYRGLVLKRHDDGKADILFVDYGNDDKVLFSRIKELRPHYEQHPSYAFMCKLNIKPTYGNWATEKSLLKKIEDKITIMREQTDVLFAKFHSIDVLPYTVDLFIPDELNSRAESNIFREFLIDNQVEPLPQEHGTPLKPFHRLSPDPDFKVKRNRQI